MAETMGPDDFLYSNPSEVDRGTRVSFNNPIPENADIQSITISGREKNNGEVSEYVSVREAGATTAIVSMRVDRRLSYSRAFTRVFSPTKNEGEFSPLVDWLTAWELANPGVAPALDFYLNGNSRQEFFIYAMTIEYELPAQPIEVTTDPALATADALDPSVVTGTDVGHLAGVVGEFSAEMSSFTLNPDLGYVVEGIPYGSASATSETETYWKVEMTQQGQLESLRIYPPDDLAPHLKGSADEVVDKSISVSITGGSPIRVRTYAEDGTLLTNTPWRPPSGLTRQTLPIPVETEYVQFYGDVNAGYGKGVQIHKDPAPTFTVTAVGDPGAYPTVEAMSASADMPDVAVSVISSADVDVEPMSAIGEVGTIIFPDWTQEVASFTATASMEDAWFRSARIVAAEAAEASGEALEPVQTADNNIIVEAATMSANGYAFDPDEVNQDMGDRFFDEIAKDNPYSWYRLNERAGEGQVAWMHTPTGRRAEYSGGGATGQYKNPSPFTGQFTRGIVAGPGGRRAVDITDANLDAIDLLPQDGHFNQYPEGTALEFVLRTTANEGMLAYAVTSITNTSDPRWPVTTLDRSIFLQDGYIYSAETRGVDATPKKVRLSASRINDGEWHHVVLNGSEAMHPGNRPGDHRRGVSVWIDGVLDRTVLTDDLGRAIDTPTAYSYFSPGAASSAATSTTTPFVGQVMEVAGYRTRLHRDRILAHYRALNDIVPVEAPIVGAAVGASGDHKVESNMRRMLILNFSRTWGRHLSGQTGPWQPFQSPGRPSENRSGLPMEDQFGKDWIPNVLETMDVTDTEDFGELGDLQITYQRVEMVHDSETVKQGWSAVGWDSEQRGHNGLNVYFTDSFTGERRFINLQQDIVDLEDYDILYVQGYPNPTLREQGTRQKYEAFLDSVNQAIIDGSKMWISNPLLAADLGLISKHEVVPTSLAMKSELDGRIYRRGGSGIMEGLYGKDTSTIVDARSWQLMPWNDKEAPFEIPEGIETAAQMYDHLRQVAPFIPKYIGEVKSTRYSGWDAWANNRYRVVNELEGLTDQPSYEITDAAFARRKNADFENAEEYELQAYRYENRSGFDDPWGYTESKGTGLKAGDEFTDGHILVASLDGAYGLNSSGRGRGYTTYAVPPGHLKAGRAITTFGQTIWQDNGKQGVNPYRDYITTAAVVPGDRINGKLIGGYVFMQFSEKAHNATKMENLPIDRNPWIEDPDNTTGDDGLTDYARSWQYATLRKQSFGRGSVQAWSGGSQRITPILDVFGSVTGYRVNSKPARSEMLPLAPLMEWRYGVVYVPHATWTFRGIRWLMDATPKLVGAVNTLANASEGTGRMLEPTTYSEKDNNISVAPANAYGVLLASDNAVGKDAQNFVLAATGTARIVDPGRTIFVESMTTIGDMGSQNIARIELGEINWLTLNRNRGLIELRVEEIGASTVSLMTIPGEVINTGGN